MILLGESKGMYEETKGSIQKTQCHYERSLCTLRHKFDGKENTKRATRKEILRVSVIS